MYNVLTQITHYAAPSIYLWRLRNDCIHEISAYAISVYFMYIRYSDSTV